MQRKIHNQTLFVAALSVYLGLLIVGAPTHLLAQQPLTKKIQQDKQSEQPLASSTDQDLLFIKEQSEIQKILFESKTPFYFAYQFEFLGGKIASQQVIAAEGDQRVIAFMRKTVEERHSDLEITAKLFSISKILHEQKVDKAEYVISDIYDFKEIVDAKDFAKNQKEIFESFKEETSNTDPFHFTTVTFENNQVFIVTRLPRAGLDAPLKANEKAN